MHVFALVNQKGGPGKTPMTWEIGAALAARGRRVIIADFDPQGTLTAGVLGPDAADYGTAEVLLRKRPLAEATQPTITPGLSILAAHSANLSETENKLMKDGLDGFLALTTALEDADAAADVMLCDCPPNLSILTSNVLTAADYVIVPIDSTQARIALSQLKRTVAASRKLNPDLQVLGAILTKFAAHQLLSADRLEAVSGDTDFFQQVWPVRLSGGFEKAFRAGKPLRAIAGSQSEKAAVEEVERIAAAIESKLGARL